MTDARRAVREVMERLVAAESNLDQEAAVEAVLLEWKQDADRLPVVVGHVKEAYRLINETLEKTRCGPAAHVRLNRARVEMEKVLG